MGSGYRRTTDSMPLTAIRRLYAQLAAAAAAGFGGFALVSWTFYGTADATLGPDYVPMAPATAGLLAVLGLGLFARVRWPETRAGRRVALLGAALATLVGALELLRLAHDFPLPWDLWLGKTETTYVTLVTGRMAPITAVNFLLLSFALSAQCTLLLRAQVVSWIGGAAEMTGLIVTGLVILAYAAGTPLGYERESVPMALPTAAAFLALYTSLLATNVGDALRREWRRQTDGGHDHAVDGYLFRWRLLVGSALGLGLCGLAAFLYVRSEQEGVRELAHAQLQSIAALKVQRITEWKNERLGDARVLAATPNLAEIIMQLSDTPDANARRARMAKLLTSAQLAYGYPQIVLFDRELNIVLTFPDDAKWDSTLSPGVRRTLRETHDVLLEDLHRSENGNVHLDVVAPIRSEGQDTFAGAMLLTINPETQLFPLVQQWPTPSASAETLLARREGEEVVFLSDPRHQPGKAMTLRRSLHDRSLLASQALRNNTRGLMQGTDYRGERVLGVSESVPGTDWVMIAKVDLAEAYAPVYARGRQMFVGFGLVVTVLGLFGHNRWQRQREDQIQRRLAAEQAARAVSERLAMVMRHANDAILVFDGQKRIVEANAGVRAFYGRSPEELCGMSVHDLHPAGTGAVTDGLFAQAIASEGRVFETEHARKDGTAFPVEVSTQRVNLEGRPHILAIVRDITQRKIHEREIERLNRVYHVISAVNQMLVRSKSQDDLFRETCRVLVETGGFRLAWIGRVNEATKLIEPVAVAGDGHDYVSHLRISLDPSEPEGRGPSGTAFREGHTYVCNDFFANPATAPWHAQAQKAEFQSSLALPIRHQGRAFALLTVYAAEKDFFAGREVGLLEETAGDLEFALEVFAVERRRCEAEAELAAALRKTALSEARFRSVFEKTGVGVALVALDGRWIDVNQRLCDILGYTRDELLPLTFRQITHPDDLAPDLRLVAQTLAGEIPGYTLEKRYLHKSGREVWINLTVSLVRSDSGGPVHFISVIEDISERKRMEHELGRVRDTLQAAMDCSQAGIALAEAPSGRLTYVNQAGLRIRGASEAEVVTGVTADLYSAVWNIRNPDGTPMAPDEIPLAHAILRAEPSSKEIVIRRAPGDDRIVLVHAAPIFDRTGQVTAAVAVFLDLTEGKRAEAKLRQFAEELRIRNETLTRFNRVAVGRELRMIELKREVNELCAQLGQPPRHLIVEAGAHAPETGA